MKTHEEVVKQIGNKIKQLRVDAGYTSHETFALENNMSRMQYWRMENGKVNFTIESLLKVLDVHKLTLEEFFGKN